MRSLILLVEDEPDVQLIVADLLRGHQHKIVVSSDGDEGSRAATEQSFDLIVLDVMLPGISGFEFCRAVRERGFDGAILMLTARTQVDDRVEGSGGSRSPGRCQNRSIRPRGSRREWDSGFLVAESAVEFVDAVSPCCGAGAENRSSWPRENLIRGPGKPMSGCIYPRQRYIARFLSGLQPGRIANGRV